MSGSARRRMGAVIVAAVMTLAAAPLMASAGRPVGSNGLLCPVDGYTDYGNSWGAPRSGGRSHEGVDLMAATGTPLVAATTGRVRFWQNKLGGRVASLYGDNGTRYYYAHLMTYAGWDRRVTQGEVIGYVGSTGNAGAPHLHFEVHPWGGAAVNPYPYVLAAGC